MKNNFELQDAGIKRIAKMDRIKKYTGCFTTSPKNRAGGDYLRIQ